MMMVDGQFVVVGSANIDMRSFTYNFEVTLQVYSRSVAQTAEEVFLEDLHASRGLDLETWEQRASHMRFAENFCRLLSPLL